MYVKFVSFKKEQHVVPGIWQDDFVIDLSSIAHSVQEIIACFSELESEIQQLVLTNPERIPLKKHQLESPIQAKRNIFCIGWNYMKHFEERVRQDIELPNHPTVFTKATTTIAAPYKEVQFSRDFTEAFDYEAELAVVIGKKGQAIAKEDALDYVFGYACANDFSARDVQQKHGGQWFLGKSIDGSCPIGPWITTKETISDVQNLAITCTVNGQIVQESNTALMIFPVATIIAELSKAMTLVPGDIILTGTPDGIGSKRNPPILLKEQDIVDVQIAELGQISNTIREKIKITGVS